MTLTQHINAIRHKLTGDLSQAEIEDLSSLRSAIGGRLSRGTGLKLRPCPKCSKMLGAREMRKHKCFDNTTVVRKPNPPGTKTFQCGTGEMGTLYWSKESS